ncbi:DUF4214 domain-containing protein [Desulfosoma sp.]
MSCYRRQRFIVVLAVLLLCGQTMWEDLNMGGIVLMNASVQAATGNTYYVAPNGNNANPGTRDKPWATPGYGSRQLRPGDTLIILDGRYVLREYDDDIITPPSGTASAWITIQGEEGRRPLLVGRDNLLTAINLSGVQYVRIANLEITHDDTALGQALYFRDGLEILGEPAAHIVLQDLYIHHIDEFGMNIQDVQDLQILNCRIAYCGFGALGGPSGEHGGWRNVTIKGCSLSWSGHYYRGSDGSVLCTGRRTDPPYCRPYPRPDGFGIEPAQGPIVIEETRAEHNYGDGLDSKAANTIIRRCIVANNSCDGVKLWGDGSRIENTLIYGRGDGHDEPSPWAPIVIDQVEQAGARFEIVNVTVDDYLGQNYLMYVQYDNTVPVEVTVRNTIFSGRGPECPIYIGPTSTLVADHNLFYLPQNQTLVTYGSRSYTCTNIASLGVGNLCGDPRFIRPAWGQLGDYHINADSPAIDAGRNDAVPEGTNTDLDGNPRIVNGTVDMGAYEYRLGTGPYSLDDLGWVTSFYVAYWGRCPDPEGQSYWLNMIRQGVLSAVGVAENFALSEEAKSVYTYFQSPETASEADLVVFVREIYLNLFNREPDSEGLNYWVGELKYGRTTPGQVIAHIINAATDGTSSDGAIVKNKVAVGEYFADRVRELVLPWSETLRNLAIQALLGVTDDPTTVEQSMQFIDSTLASL